MVEDFSSASEYEAWGDFDGDLFCCASDPQYNPTIFLITGSAFADTLQFTEAGTTSNLTPTTATAITATINAGDGNDIVKGSFETASYAETLNGEADDDVVTGNPGADIIDGGTGNDELNGNEGADAIYGGDGNGQITGGDGEDLIEGGAGVDYIFGGADDDDIDGGTEGDVMCGDGEGAGGDVVDAGDANAEAVPDKIWSANAAGRVECEDNSTYWDGVAGTTDIWCLGNPTLSVKPAACP